MTLDDVKIYLRVDGDDEDALITGLMTAVALEVKRKTGKTRVKLDTDIADITTDELYCLAVKIGVADAYENRGSDVTGKSITKYSRSFESLVNFIAMCGDYV